MNQLTLLDTGGEDLTVATVPGEAIQYSDYTLDMSDPLAGGCAWIEGEYLPLSQARISIFDAGFGHSDVTYTVAHVWHGNFFRLAEHVDRFIEGAERMRIPMPMSRDEVMEIMRACVAKSGLREAYVNVCVTRGYGKKPGEKDLEALESQVYVYAIPYLWVFSPIKQIEGVDAVIARSVRRSPANVMDPWIKNYHWGDLVRATFEAQDRGARTAFLLDADGFVTEGPGYNILMIKDGHLYTAARNVLPGITRRTALEIAENFGIPCTLGDVSPQMLASADEIFVTTTAGGVTPVIKLDGQPIGDGTPGPWTRKIRTRYWELMDEPSPLIEPVDYSS